jgi:hypothetical protein
MALLDILKNIPDIGRETFLLVWKPRTYLINKKDNPAKFISTRETFLWLLAVSLLLMKIYSTLFRPIGEDLLRASPFKCADSTNTTIVKKENDRVKPSVEKIIWWSPGFGVSFNFAEHCRLSNEPQYFVFGVGGVYVLIKNLKPEQFGQTGFLAFVFIILTLVFTFCIYPSMRLLKRNTSFKELVKFSLVFIASYFFVGTLLATVTAAIGIHVLHLKGWTIYFVWVFIVLLPFLILFIRGYFASYSQLFDSNKKRLFWGSVISAFLSWAVSPLVFVPLLYLLLWLIPIYELIV